MGNYYLANSWGSLISTTVRDDGERVKKVLKHQNIEGYAIGYREWYLSFDRELMPIIRSSHSADSTDRGPIWPYKEPLEAICTRGEMHSVPFLDCMCGIYARKEWDNYWADAYGHGSVSGKVALWGRTIDYTEGWRAQFACPLEVYLNMDCEYHHDIESENTLSLLKTGEVHPIGEEGLFLVMKEDIWYSAFCSKTCADRWAQDLKKNHTDAFNKYMGKIEEINVKTVKEAVEEAYGIPVLPRRNEKND